MIQEGLGRLVFQRAIQVTERIWQSIGERATFLPDLTRPTRPT